MINFDMKQWLMENKQGMYSKIGLNEMNPTDMGKAQQAADKEMETQETNDSDDLQNQQMDVSEETVGWANQVAPSDSKLQSYLEKLKTFDWFYMMSDDHRVYDRGDAEKRNLKQLYSELTPEEKQTALDAYKASYERFYPPQHYPGTEQTLKTLTTQNFSGM
jgi:hypothetical protein